MAKTPKCKRGKHKWGKWRRAFRLEREERPFNGRVRKCQRCGAWQAQEQQDDGTWR